MSKHIAYRQLELTQVPRREFRQLKRKFETDKDLKQYLELIDDRTIMLKFDNYIPETDTEVESCKQLNEETADLIMTMLQRTIDRLTKYSAKFNKR